MPEEKIEADVPPPSAAQPPPSSENDSATQNPPTLDYPSRPAKPEVETESWSEVIRAMLIVFGFLAALFLIGFGFCGIFSHGCR